MAEVRAVSLVVLQLADVDSFGRQCQCPLVQHRIEFIIHLFGKKLFVMLIRNKSRGESERRRKGLVAIEKGRGVGRTRETASPPRGLQ